MFDYLGTLISRRWAWVLGLWLLLVAAIGLLAPRWDDITRDGDFAYLPPEMTSVQGEKLLEAGFPQVLSKSQVAIVVARPDGPLSGSDFEVADRLVGLFTPQDGDRGPITTVWSYESQVVGRKLMSDSGAGGQAVLIVLHLGSEFMAIDNMRLLRTVHRSLDVVQLEEAVRQAIEQQEQARLAVVELHRKPAEAGGAAGLRLAEAQVRIRDELLANALWFRGTAREEVEPVEEALQAIAQAVESASRGELAEAARQSEALAAAQAPGPAAAAVQGVAASQDRAIKALRQIHQATDDVLAAMRRLAIAENHALDAVPDDVRGGLAAVGARMASVFPAGPAGAVADAGPGEVPAGGPPGGLKVGVTGSAAVGSDMLFAARESIRNTELTTIVLVVLILLVVYRAPGLVVVPVITIVASTAVAMGLVALASEAGRWLGWFDFTVFKTTKIFIVVLLFGAGTDFCLFLIARYKEELQRGLEPRRAVAHALARVSDALCASALTTVLGLGTMVFADFGKFRNSGPVIAFCLVVVLAASITLAPALLRGLGRGVFWPLRLADAGNAQRNGGERNGRGNGANSREAGPSLFGRLWEWIAGQVVTRPGLILVGSVLLLCPLAVKGVSVPVTYDLLNELPPDRPSVRGTRLLEQFFLAAETGPVTLLAESPEPRFASREGRDQIARLTAELYDLQYTDSAGRAASPIVSVRSLSEPLGGPPGSFNPLSAEGRGKLAVLKHPRTKARFVAQAPAYEGRVTRFDLVCQYAPFSREAVRLLDHVEKHLDGLAADPDSPWHGMRFHLAGTTAAVRDLATVTSSDQWRIQRLVVLAVLAVLIVVLRQAAVSVYMILSVLFGYFVTMGVTQWFFGLCYGPTFDGLDWKVPVFLFVILIAVGQDYNIYLATRALEEQRRRGWREGLRVAVVRTGGIITSCGVIMAGTFASMATGPLRAMQELGFALAFGVLLDTLVIRTVLLPAFLALWRRGAEPAWREVHAAGDDEVPPEPHLSAVGYAMPTAGRRAGS